MRPAENLTLYNGKKTSIWSLAKERGIPATTLLSRWAKAGRPRIISEDLLFKAEARKPLVIDGVKYKSLNDAAAGTGKSYSWLMKRLQILGKRKTTMAEIESAKRTRDKLKVRLKGHGEVLIGCLPKILNGNRTAGFFANRWRSLGCPKIITAEMFEDKLKPTVPAQPEYTDPDYLPHIQWGDLAHLSDRENTGAGKGEIPDEEWIARKFCKESTSIASVSRLNRKGNPVLGDLARQRALSGDNQKTHCTGLEWNGW